MPGVGVRVVEQRGLRVCKNLKYRDAISILPVVSGIWLQLSQEWRQELLVLRLDAGKGRTQTGTLGTTDSGERLEQCELGRRRVENTYSDEQGHNVTIGETDARGWPHKWCESLGGGRGEQVVNAAGSSFH